MGFYAILPSTVVFVSKKIACEKKMARGRFWNPKSQPVAIFFLYVGTLKAQKKLMMEETDSVEGHYHVVAVGGLDN